MPKIISYYITQHIVKRWKAYNIVLYYRFTIITWKCNDKSGKNNFSEKKNIYTMYDIDQIVLLGTSFIILCWDIICNSWKKINKFQFEA